MLARRKRERSGIERAPRRHFPSHLAWIRGFTCAALESGECEGRIEASHLRSGLPPGESAGIGEKPHDKWAAPLCAKHHAESHRIGEASFQAKYKLDLRKICERLAAISPHRKAWQE